MTQSIPAFWVRYRGVVDPQRPNDTTYTYVASLYYNLAVPDPATVVTFNVLGPPQLSKHNYMEIRWTIPPGVILISINKVEPTVATPWYQTNAAEQGTRDEGQFNIVNGGVQNI